MATLDFALIGGMFICIFSIVISLLAYLREDIKLYHDKEGNINPNEASISHYLESKDGIEYMNNFMHDKKFLNNDTDFIKKNDKVKISATDGSGNVYSKIVTVI